MSVSGLFNIGTSALQAAYAQLQVTGNNIANVDTPGYSRQTAVLATAGSIFRNGSFYGRGVDVVTVARLYDRFLGERVQSGTAIAAGDAARASGLSQLETLVSREGAGVGVAVDALRQSIADLVARPADASVRTVVLGRMQALAETFRSLSSGIESQAAGLEAQLADDAQRLNGLLGQLAELNAGIGRLHVPGHTPNDLLDQRDALLAEVSALVRVSPSYAEDGTVTLRGAGGNLLLDASGAASFGVEPDPLDATRSVLVLQSGGTTTPVTLDMLGAGRLAGTLEFRDGDLAAVRNALGQLAGAIAGAWNATHAQGVDADGLPGGDLFAVAAPRIDAATDNAGGASFGVTVVDAAQLAASDYALEWDGSQYTLTRLADGQLTSIAAWPVTVDGLEIAAPTGAPAAGDRFLLRSASLMAGSFTALPLATNQLATGLPGAEPAADNRNALNLLALGDEALVGGLSATDAWARVLADVGERSRSAQGAQSLSEALLSDARMSLGSVSGVNLDEEAARLLQYQQSYQAAAKVIATAQTVFDTLLDIAR